MQVNRKKLEKTTNRREYKLIKQYVYPYDMECGICPRYHKHLKCKRCNPNSTNGMIRNWKEFRKTQYKTL